MAKIEPDKSVIGKPIGDIKNVYKGDGINNCKWCGDTGYMHTFSLSGYFYEDAPCVCGIGQKILDEKINNG